MLNAFATCSRCTGDSFTDFNTNAIETVANFVCGTVIVTLATDWYANDGGIALHTGRTITLRSMESDATECVRSTLIAAKDARIQTLSSDTGSIGRTVVIHNAFSCRKKDMAIINL